MARPPTEYDWEERRVPLYDQKEFKDYAIKVVLKAIKKTPASRRQIKQRLGKKIVEIWVDHALDYLVLYGHVTTGSAVLITMYSLSTVVQAPPPSLTEGRFPITFGSHS